MTVDESFLRCGSCGATWGRWQDCVLDRELRLLGLQVVPHLPQANLLVFQHSCGTTVSVLAQRLRPLLDADDPAFPQLYSSDQCNGHCGTLSDMLACDRRCANASYRRLTQLVEEIKRTGQLPAGLTAP
jgi:hypothetical protein